MQGPLGKHSFSTLKAGRDLAAYYVSPNGNDSNDLSVPSKRVETLPPFYCVALTAQQVHFQYPQSGSRPCRLARSSPGQVCSHLSVPSKRVETLPQPILFSFLVMCSTF